MIVAYLIERSKYRYVKPTETYFKTESKVLRHSENQDIKDFLELNAGFNNQTALFETSNITQSTVTDISRFLHSWHNRYVIIAGPGHGKTTVSQFICQLFRAALLVERNDVDDLAVRDALKDFKHQYELENNSLPVVRRFPIKIVLKDFAQELANQDINSVFEYIATRISKRTGTNVRVKTVKLWLLHYPWLIIWDGLDEVPASSNRQEVLNAVNDFMIDASGIDAQIMAIATTRPQGYNADFDRERYTHIYLAKLSSSQARHYAKRLIAHRFTGEDDTQNKILERVDRALAEPHSSRLMTTPLQVTIMVLLLSKSGSAPKDRWSLFDKYYQTIYDREVDQDIPAASAILNDYRDDIDTIHGQVGLLLQVESEISGSSDNKLPIDKFEELIETHLSAEGTSHRQINRLMAKIVKAAANRLVFLVGLEQGVVGFDIRSLMEFTASEAIWSGSEEEIKERFKAILPVASWRNVTLFTVGRCFTSKGRKNLRDFIYEECCKLNSRDKIHEVCLTGSELALEIIEEGAVTFKQKYLRLFTKLALRLLDLPQGNIHVRLAKLYGDKNFAGLYQQEIETRIVQQNFHLCSGAWACLLVLVSEEVQWAIDLVEKYRDDDPKAQFEMLSPYLYLYRSSVNKSGYLSGIFAWILPQLSPAYFEDHIHQIESFFYHDSIATKLTIGALTEAIDKHSSIKNDVDLINEREAFPEIIWDSMATQQYFAIIFKTLDLIVPEDNYYQPLLFSQDEISELATFKGVHHYWRVYEKVMQFWLNPTPQILGECLSLIVIYYDKELVEWLHYLVPWQIGECLAFANSASELEVLAEKALAGNLGNVEIWSKAELRWQVGIKETDLFYVPATGQPFDRAIAELGYPMWSSNYYLFNFDRSPSKLITLFARFIELFKKVECIAVKTKIADVTIRLINEPIIKPELKLELSSANLLTLKKMFELRSVKQEPLYIKEIIYGIFEIYLLTGDLAIIKSLNRLGINNDLKSYLYYQLPNSEKLFSSLRSLYLADKQLVGILNILLALSEPALKDDLAFISDICELDLYSLGSRSNVQSSLLVTKIKYGKLLDTEIEKALELIKGKNIRDNRQVFKHFATLINIAFQEADVVDYHLLNAIIKNFSDFTPLVQSAFIDSLKEIIAQNASVLTNLEDWQRLGLPSGVADIIFD